MAYNLGEHDSQMDQGDETRLVNVPVLIVGGGPSGLLLAYMLSQFEIKSLVIEKYPERLAAPKAHALCPRTLELCRQFGIDTRALRKLGSPREDAYWVNFVTNLSGEQIGILPYERMDANVLDHTPEMIHNIPQPHFEQFIASALHEDKNVEIRKGVAFLSCTQTAKEVTTTVVEQSSKMQYLVRSRHVLACDGAKSTVRASLGIESEGEDGYETMMTIHFNADLRPVMGERVGMLHWITDPACSGFIIAYDLSNNHVLISNFDPSKQPVDTWNEHICRSVVSAAIGRDVPFDVLSYRPWVLSRKVARQYNVGNVFLVGDAAHSFPPTGGLGLNSGLADAHNLAYKIAAVHQTWGRKRLLESYGAERRHIALVNAAQSVKNGKQIFSFLKTLGVAGIEDVEEARQNLVRSIHDKDKQEMIAREVEAQREHFDNLEIHIGYVYGSKETPANASHYAPKFVPGARLPHAWINFTGSSIPSNLAPFNVSYIKEWTVQDVENRKWSTLDLCPFNAFTLIVGSREDWQRRFSELKVWVVPMVNIRIEMYAADADYEFVFEDQRELFRTQSSLLDGGGFLMRPDQHILMLLTPQTTADQMALALRQHLGFNLNI